MLWRLLKLLKLLAAVPPFTLMKAPRSEGPNTKLRVLIHLTKDTFVVGGWLEIT